MATQKIHFFTGKGGVGKSVISASFALYFACEKKSKILLAELSEDKFLANLFKTYKTTVPTLEVTHWNAQNCLEEYATQLLKSESLSKLLLNNKISKSLINIAPGLQELAILGKATSGGRNFLSKSRNDYDEIFIDSFASGHFVNLMSAPQSFSEVFSIGPMSSQSKSIDKFIKNPDHTKVHIVTLADELSITEAVELNKTLNDLNIKSDFILNKFIDTNNIILNKLPKKTNQFFKNINEQQNFSISELKQTKSNFLCVPYIFENNLKTIVENIPKKIGSLNEFF